MLGRLRWDSVGGGGIRKGGVTIIIMWMNAIVKFIRYDSNTNHTRGLPNSA